MLNYLIIVSIRPKYVPQAWKESDYDPETKWITTMVTYYKPISLLPTAAKLYENIILRRLKPILDKRNLIPSHHNQDFEKKHSTINQVHRILYHFSTCSAGFWQRLN